MALGAVSRSDLELSVQWSRLRPFSMSVFSWLIWSSSCNDLILWLLLLFAGMILSTLLFPIWTVDERWELFSSYIYECVWRWSRGVYGGSRSKVRSSALLSLDDALFLLTDRLDLGVRRIPRPTAKLHGRPPARSSLQKHTSVTLWHGSHALVLEGEKMIHRNPHSLELSKQVSSNRICLSAPIRVSFLVLILRVWLCWYDMLQYSESWSREINTLLSGFYILYISYQNLLFFHRPAKNVQIIQVLNVTRRRNAVRNSNIGLTFLEINQVLTINQH